MTVIEQAEFFAGKMMFIFDLQSTMCSQCTTIRVVNKHIGKKQGKRKTVYFANITQFSWNKPLNLSPILFLLLSTSFSNV